MVVIEEVPISEEELRERAESRPGRLAYERFFWVENELPNRPCQKRRMKLFGEIYERRDYSSGNTYEYWYIPLQGGDVCVKFCSNDPVAATRFFASLRDYESLSGIIEDFIELGLPGESYWIYDYESNSYAGPHGPAVTAENLHTRLRILRTYGVPVGVQLEWFSKKKRVTPDEQTDPPPSPVEEVNWQILPPGYVERMHTMSSGRRKRFERQYCLTRLKVLQSMGPTKWWRGKHVKGASEYLVAEFPDCVVAECPLYANAIYVYKTKDAERDWKEVFCLTRKEIRELGGIQVRHDEGWEDVLKNHIWG